MERKIISNSFNLKIIGLLNITMVILYVALGSYLAYVFLVSTDINNNDKDIIGIFIGLISTFYTLLLISLLIRSIIFIKRNSYKPNIQKLIGILIALPLAIAFVIFIKFFKELSLGSVLIFCILILSSLLLITFSFRKIREIGVQ